MKILSGILSPWGRLHTTIFGSLVGGGQNDNDNPERRKKVATIATVVIIASLISLCFTMCERSPKVNRAPFIGRGEALADETAKAIGNRGTVVPVIADFHTASSAPVAGEWQAFTKTIKKHKDVTLAKPVIVKLDDNMNGPSISRDDFDALVKKHATAGAIVLLVGLPMWDAKDPLTLPTVTPKIIAIQGETAMLKQYFINSIATALIIPRIEQDANVPSKPKNPRQWFDKYFQIVTAQNYQSLPD